MRVAMAASLSSSPYTCSSKSIVLSKCSPKIKLGTNRFTISASTSVLSGGSPLLQAAKHTVDAYVKSGMVVGLGSGQASGMAIQYLGRLLRAGALKDIVGVPMSIASASEAAKAGIPLDQFNDSSQDLNSGRTIGTVRHSRGLYILMMIPPVIDFSFDDADIIEEGTLIAVIGHRKPQVEDSIIQEKSILNASNQLAFMIKESQYMGGPEGSIPVLVNSLNWMQTAEEIDDLFLGDAEVWRRPSIGHAGPLGGDFPFVTREGHNVLDVIFTSPISSLAEVAESLDQIDGVVDHGVISKFPCTAVIAAESGLQIIDNVQKNMA
ncbi:probable ribose-5-phosphate isomerase 4, chloroplastic isoform X1 [Cucumis melo]|uniref:ribose-5-phosphate isomerase n=1 Tax=Cucumis melo TaxID=3656 RepID=A0ABM3KFP7_CUCME|nr:probable ribose-5-phosphate isomerase 4, chloroplastic isoform X1 [Cucumis melo]XP_050936599.1 probable ribose-5-phosphate isomerase 4, chloroplastic isoform X1 [Cucumis melo]XP_050936600.1 probable ribose-5-phosphate isomerase 4, chloroplastic isoform X1 [Cucumis melo]XP_050936601.1 probable ribose-5-phosphate isomerase 4, chloroplastic isoform X1 [Cucumis melo]XP_050936602.1 probable ribose-5-phosphate isomerase 4, chloroplastic isoform X1 [Cucumis melo]